ncbi:MAG: hypothetical protein RXN90_06415 [Thermoproteus sp.]
MGVQGGVEEMEIYRRYAESEVRWRPDLALFLGLLDVPQTVEVSVLA